MEVVEKALGRQRRGITHVDERDLFVGIISDAIAG